MELKTLGEKQVQLATKRTVCWALNICTNVMPSRNCGSYLVISLSFAALSWLRVPTQLSDQIFSSPHSQNYDSLPQKSEALGFIKPVCSIVFQFSKFKILKVKFSLELRNIWSVLNEIRMTENKEIVFIKLGT